MKYSLLFFLFTYSCILHSQQTFFTKEKTTTHNYTSQIAPFSLKNSKKNIDYLKSNGLEIKFITKNYIYCNAVPDLMREAHNKGDIEEVYFEISSPQALADSAVVQHKADMVHSGFGGLDTSYTGKGVIVGVVDNGIDFNHPDFQNTDGSTRVLRYWDHTVNDPMHPNYSTEYGLGIVWDSSEINADLCTSLEIGSAHGSTVAGMAAGNGSANGTNKGFAPEADLIVVETNYNLPNWSLSIAYACDYIFKVADSLGMPAVVNLSLGSYYGSHDGLDPAAELIDSLLDAKEGRIVVCAAGNSGNDGPYHVGNDVTQDTSFVWMVSNPNVTWIGLPNTILIEFWADTSTSDFYFSYAADSPGPNYEKRGETDFHHISNDITDMDSVLIEPILNSNSDQIAEVWTIRKRIGGSIYGQIAFVTVDSTDYLFRFQTYGTGRYDLWGGSFNGHSDFVSTIPTPAEMPEIVNYVMPDTLQTIVDNWNCSEKVISVGNLKNRSGHVDFNGNTYTEPTNTAVGELTLTSSKGPSRDGVQKPDISASGDVSLGSGSFSWLDDPAYNGSIDEGGFHIRNGGTSMASPAVAGIAALYLQKCPKASFADFKTDLTMNADIDGFTGSVPNFAYGYGKANALQTVLAKHNPVVIDGPGGICPGETVTLSYTTNMNALFIDWSNGSNAQSIVTTTPDDYQVVLEDAMGCISRSPIHQVVIYSEPFVDAGSDQLICPNIELTLTASGTAITYDWNNNVTNGVSFYPISGTYIVEGTNSSGCSATDSLTVEFLSVLPVTYNEVVTSIGLSETAFNVTPGDPLGGTYSGDGIIGTTFHPSLAGIGTSALVYSYVDGNGCVSSDTSYIEVYDDVGISEQQDFEWSVYPNPFQNEIYVAVTEAVKIELFDLAGKILLNTSISESRSINVDRLSQGIYTVKITAIHSDKAQTIQLIKN